MDKPIIFNAEMVRAILDGRKTQTRRPIKKQPAGTWAAPGKTSCPLGRCGDLLWVRETTEFDDEYSQIVSLSRYKADREPVLYSGCDDPEYNGSVAHWSYSREVRPSIHMPRWASRLTLKITDIRVERVQDITDQNAVNEGIEVFNEDGNLWYSGWMEGQDSWFSDNWKWHCDDPMQAFKELWDGIYFKSKNGWVSNPWVWVISFEVINQNIDEYLKDAA